MTDLPPPPAIPLAEFRGYLHPLRTPCSVCGSSDGIITTTNGQDIVRCAQCDRYQYCAPRTETGREQRSVRTRPEIKPAQKARIIGRDGNRCVLCGAGGNIHIGHLISVDEGRLIGLSTSELYNDENLAVMCEECNLGWSSTTLPLKLIANVLLVRIARQSEAADDPDRPF